VEIISSLLHGNDLDFASMRTMRLTRVVLAVFALLLAPPAAFGGENLRLNPKLDYTSDSHDGPLITGDRMEEGAVKGKPNYVIIYGERCYNSKRQARRTVSLYEKYKGRVHFVIIDLDLKHSREQQKLIDRFYEGYIPHVVVLDAQGKAVYDFPAEIEEEEIAKILDKLLK
jgi:hypothetical protein